MLQAEEIRQLLATFAGILLSLGFSYIPGLRNRYQPLSSTWKSLIMLFLIAVSAVGVYGVSCLRWWVFVPCTQKSILDLVEAFIMCAIANQTTYRLSPQLPTKTR